MIRYKSTRQMSIEEYKTPFQVKLDNENRWVKLGNSLPWDSLTNIYYRSMCSGQNAPAIDAKIVIGAMIVKHKLKLGLEEYTYKDVFDRSLFTTLRYRLGADKFDAMTSQIILTSEGKGEAEGNDPNDSASSGNLQEGGSITSDRQSVEKPRGNTRSVNS